MPASSGVAFNRSPSAVQAAPKSIGHTETNNVNNYRGKILIQCIWYNSIDVIVASPAVIFLLSKNRRHIHIRAGAHPQHQYHVKHQDKLQ